MRKILMLLMCALVCMHIQAQTLLSRTTWIKGNGSISYTVYEPAKDTIYYCTFTSGAPVSHEVTLRFRGRNKLVSTLLFLFSLQKNEGYRYLLTDTMDGNTALVGDEKKGFLGWDKYVTIRSSKKEMQEDVSVTLEEIGNRYLKPLGVIVDTKQVKRNAKRTSRYNDNSIDDAYKY